MTGLRPYQDRNDLGLLGISTEDQSTKGDHVTTDANQNELGQLIDQRRQLAAQLAGVELQIAMAVGDRDGARRHLKEMNAQTEARKAARFAMCRAMGAH